MYPRSRKARYGEIKDYLSSRFAEDRAVGLPSDDTQMAFWTVENLLQYGRLVPEALAATFCEKQIYGIGRTVREFIRQHKDLKMSWYESGVASAGNGALMRIAPVLLPHLRHPSSALWADAALAAFLTHNDRGSTASCIAFINLLWNALRMDTVPPRGWWVNTFCQVARELEGDTRFSPRNDSISFQHCGPLWVFTETVVNEALSKGLPVLDACESWHSGAYLLETVPCFIYILETCCHDPELAIIRAVNDTRDNDTIASIVGAAVGALHGKKALPERWVKNLLGRTEKDDDGHLFTLIDRCKSEFLEQKNEQLVSISQMRP